MYRSFQASPDHDLPLSVLFKSVCLGLQELILLAAGILVRISGICACPRQTAVHPKEVVEVSSVLEQQAAETLFAFCCSMAQPYGIQRRRGGDFR